MPQDNEKKASKSKPALKGAGTAQSKGALLSLESRLMFDAAATATVAEVNQEQVAQEQAEAAVSGDSGTSETQASSESDALLSAISTYMPVESRTEIVFVDPTVPNYQDLLSGLDPSIEVIMLDGGQDGIEQMAGALAGRTGIDAIHLISHGEAGALQLGTGTLNVDTMSGQYADELANIQQALSGQADILVYGCDFAEGQAGQDAVTLLSQLTGADVAASTDDTGYAGLGGDWDLEFQVGTVEAQGAIDYDTQADWVGLLGLTASGGETRVNTTTTGTQTTNSLSDAYTPDSVAMDANGNYVTVWESAGNIYGQRYNSAGTAQGSEFVIASNAANERLASVAMNASGAFVVTWERDQGTGDYDIYARLYNSSGTAVGSEFLVNEATTYDQEHAHVAMAADGSFVVVFESNIEASGTYYDNIYAQRYDATGTKIGSNFLVNTTTAGDQNDADIAMDSAGNFVVVWAGERTAGGSAYSIYGQRYNTSGVAQGGEFLVNAVASNNDQHASVAMNDSGNFVVTWDRVSGSDADIQAQRFNSSGVAQGTAISVTNTTSYFQEISNVSMDQSGNFVVSWSSNNQDGSGWGVYTRQYDSTGTSLTTESRVATTTTNSQDYSGIAYQNGKVVVTWSGNGTGDSSGIFMQRYDATAPNSAPVLADTVLSITVTEDAGAPSGAVGSLISTFTGGITDADNGAYKGIAITGTNETNGTWYYTTNGGTTWTAVGAVSNTSALLLADNANTRLYFQPNANYNGTVSNAITLRAWDQTGGSNGTKVSLTTSNSVLDSMGSASFSNNNGTANWSGSWIESDASGSGATTGSIDITSGYLRFRPTTVGNSLAREVDLSTATSATFSFSMPATFLTTGQILVQVSSNGGSSYTTLETITSASATGTRSYDISSYMASNTRIRFYSSATDSSGIRIDDVQVQYNTVGGGSSAYSLVSDTASVVVTAVNDAPTITSLSGDSLAYNEGDGAVVIEQGGNALVADVDSTNFDTGTLTVSFTAGSDSAEDVLSIRNQGTSAGQIGVSGSTITYGGTTIGTFTGGSGGSNLVITFNSNATPTAVTALVKNITYQDTDTSAPTTGARTIRFALTDGDGGTSASYDTTVTVSAVNDAPVLADTALTLTVAEDAGVPSGAVGSAISAFTGGITDVDSGASKGIAITGTNETNGTWYYTTNGGTTWTAVGTVSNTSALLLADNASTRLYFAPGANYNGTSTGALTLRAWDQTSGTAGTKVTTASNGGTTAFSSATDTIDVTVSAVNDAPVLADTALTLTVAEDAGAPSGAVGSTISSFTGGITDVDSSALKGIAITGTNETSGTWYYTTNGGTTWTAVGTVSNTSALLLADNASTRLYFAPGANYNGTSTGALTLRAWDQTSGAAGTKVTTASNGGTTAFSSATDTIDVTVSAVNDAPTITSLSGDSLAYNEGDGAVVIEQGSNALVADVDSTNLDTGTVTVSFTAGSDSVEDVLSIRNQGTGAGQIGVSGSTITYGGTTIGTFTGGSSGTNLVITLNSNATPTAVTALVKNITYQNTDTNAPTTGARTVRFVLTDGDGGASANYDTTVTVSGVNDAPVLDNSGVMTFTSITEDDTNNSGQTVASIIASAGGDRITDADSGASEGIAITSLTSGSGTWQYNTGSGWTNVGTVSESSALLLRATDSLRFVPDGEGADSGSISFRAWDQTSGSAGSKVATGTTSTVLDQFNSTSFSNNNGTQNWAGAWIETDAGGSGAAGGSIQISSNQLRFDADTVGDNIAREVDLSTTTGSTLTFSYNNTLTGADRIEVRVSSNGGASYTTLTNGTFSGSLQTGSGSASYDISAYASSNTRIQFIVTGTGGNDRFYVDNVQISSTSISATGAFSSATETASITVTAANDAPTDLSLSANTVVENAANGTVVGTVSGTDPDSGDTKTYSFTDSAGGRFAINSSTGQITVANGSLLNYEAATSHTVTVRVTDSGGLTYDETFTINLTNVNETPTDLALSANTVAENAANGTVVGSVTGTDPDTGDTKSYSFTDSAGGRFAINSSTGQITVANGSLLNYEAATSHTVTVRVTDSGGLTYDETFTINLTNVNETPTDLALSANTVAENAANGTVVGSVTGTDPDSGDTKTYSFTDSAGGRFAINSSTGQVTVANSSLLNYEAATSHSVTVRVTDSGGLTYDETFTINVTNVNEAPTGADATVTINEDTSHTLTTANFGFSDVDAGDSLSAVRIDTLPGAGTLRLSGVAVTAGQVISVADITAGNLVFTPAANANGTGYASFTFSVRDSNSTYDTAPNTFTVNVTAVNDAPTISYLAGDSQTYSEGDGAVIIEYGLDSGVQDVDSSNFDTGTLTVSIPFGGDSAEDVLSIRHQGTAGGQIGVSGSTVSYQGVTIGTFTGGTSGNPLVITFNSNATVAAVDVLVLNITYRNTDTDAPTPGARTVRFALTDGDGGTSANYDTTITVTAVNDTPTDLSLSANTVAENAANGTVVGTVSGTDPDSGDTKTYSFTDSAGGRFAINSSTGEITVANGSLLNYEAATSHSVTVRVTDSGGLTYDETFTINLTNVNETPTDLALSTNTVAENAANGTVVGTVSGTDPDSGDTKAYSFTDSAGGRFSINSSTGQITVANSSLLNYESATSHNVTVRVTDAGGLTYDETFTINLTNVNEAPTGADATVTINEDTSHTLTTGNFGFSDVDAGDSLSAVRIDTLPGAGTLRLSGVAVTAGQAVSVADITAGNLVFTPAANANGTGYASFTFSVRDSSSTYDTTPNTFTVNVTAVNDAPVNTVPGAQTVAVDTPLVISGLSVSDVDGNLTTVQLSVTNGTIDVTLSGGATVSAGASGTSTVTLTGTQADINATLSSLTYQGNSLFTGTDTLTMLSTDGNGATDSDTVQIAVLNNAPTNVLPAAQTAVEDTPLAITGLSVTDGDGNLATVQLSAVNGTLAVTLSGGATISSGANGSNSVTLSGSQADLNATLASLTYQGHADFSGSDTLTITSTDSLGTADTDNLSITVTSVNETPTDLALSANTVAENAANGTVVGTVTGTDPDPGDTKSYSFTDSAGGRFAINSATGQITVADSSLLNYEAATSHSVTVRVTDSGGLTYDETFTINLTDVNETPTLISLSNNTVAENAANGTIVGTASTTDPDAGDVHTYSLLDSAGGRFTIDSNTGVITVADGSLLDYDSAASHNLTIRTTDAGGLTHDQAVTINLTNVNETPTDLALSANTVAENAANGTVVGSVTGTDPDSGDTKTYSFTDSAGGRFAINSSTGQITVANSSLLNYEAAMSHSVTVRVTDSGGLTYDETFAINVTNVNEAPTGADITVTISEDTAHTMTTTDFGFSDVDAGDSLSAVRIDSLPGAGSLTLSGVAVTAGQVISVADITAGDLVFTPAADANGTGYATFTFSVRDSNNAYDAVPNTLTVDVTAVNDAPVVTPIAPDVTFVEDGLAQVIDATGTITDVDSANFDGGVMTVAITQNGSADDRLLIGNFGTGLGQVGTSGSNVTYEGVVVGTFTGGSSGSDPLVITFNGSATPAAVQEVYRSIQFDNGSHNPSTAPRQITFGLTDGDGGTATPQTKLVYVQAIDDAPIDLSLSGNLVAENAANGTVVGTVMGTDPDTGDTLTYSFTDSAGGRFAINSSTGQITVANGSLLNYEAATSHSLTVRVTDSSGLTYDETFTINLTDINEAPTLIGLTGTTVAENAANGTVVGTAGTTDPDAGDTHTYSLLDDAGGRFAIDSNTGVITVADGSLLDYDSAASHGLTIRATDAVGLTYDQAVTINLTNVNETPTDLALSANTVAENAANGTVVGSVTGTDPDSGDTKTYSFTDSAGGRFAINGTTGEITVADGSLLNYEAATSHTVTVRVTDAGGLTYDETFTINLTDINDAPTDLALSANTVAENAANGTVVGTVSGTDPDSGDTKTYSFTDSAGGRFAINSTTGEITVADGTLLDYEAATSHTVTVRVTDSGGLTYDETFAINLTDVNEIPTDLALSANTVAENAANGTVVGIVSGTDPDSGDTKTYSFTDSAGGRFAINSTTGEITVADGTLLDYEAATSHTVTVRVTDSGGLTYAETFTINLTDVNEAPTGGDATVTIAEDTSYPLTTADFGFSDVDAGDSLSAVRIDSLPGAGSLTLSGVAVTAGQVVSVADLTAGNLVFTPAADANGAGYASVTFSVQDSGGLSDSGPNTLTFDVTPVNDAPVNTVPGAQTVAEDTPLAISGLSVSDVDGNLSTIQLAVGNGTVSVTLSGSATISAGANGTGTLTLSGSQVDLNATLATLVYQGSLNYTGADTLTVTSTDANSGSDVDTVAITVTAVDDPTIVTGGTSGSGTEDSIITNTLTATDAEGLSDGTVFTVSANATNGTASIDPATGLWSYTPNADFNGSDSFTVTITDDAGNTATQVISVTVTPVADLTNDSLTTAEDTAISANVLTGTSGATADSFEGTPVLTGVTQGANGSVTFLADGTVTYTPNANFSGTDSFTYTITSGGVTETATVTVTVTAVNDATVVTGGASGTGNEDTTLTGTLTATDPDGLSDGTVFSVSTPATNGTASIDPATGLWSYQPNPDYNGTDSFTVTLTDDAGTSTTQLISVTVTPVNDAPILVTNSGSTVAEGGTDTIDASELAVTDVDNSAAQLTYTISTGPASGRLELTTAPGVTATTFTQADIAANRLVYLHNGSETTSDSFTVTVNDGAGGAIGPTTVTLMITPVNDTPTITSGGGGATAAFTVAENVSAVTIVTGADVDLPAQALTYSLSGGVDQARFTINAATGALNFIVPPDFEVTTDANGDNVYVVQVQVTDSQGASTTQTIQVTVTDVLEGVAPPPPSLPVPPILLAPTPPPPTGSPTPGPGIPPPGGPTPPITSGPVLGPGPSGAPVPPVDERAIPQGPLTLVPQPERTGGKVLEELKRVSEDDKEAPLFLVTDEQKRPLFTVLPVEPTPTLEPEPPEPTASVSELLMAKLDEMTVSLEQAVSLSQEHHELMARITAVTGTTLSVGFIAWALRSGALVASLLATMPAWQHFDPLPVVKLSRSERTRRRDVAAQDQQQEAAEFKGLKRVLGEEPPLKRTA